MTEYQQYTVQNDADGAARGDVDDFPDALQVELDRPVDLLLLSHCPELTVFAVSPSEDLPLVWL